MSSGRLRLLNMIGELILGVAHSLTRVGSCFWHSHWIFKPEKSFHKQWVILVQRPIGLIMPDVTLESFSDAR